MKIAILAAGFGSRLWPLSTSEKPKQFQPLIDGQSLLGYTYAAVGRLTAKEDIFVLGLKGMHDLITEQLPGLNPKNIVLVPERRNTLPHTLWTLAKITKDAAEPVLFKSVDQFILNPEEFTSTVARSIEAYEHSQPALTLLCTSYGKFNSNDGYCIVDDAGVIRKFLEKPTEEALEQASNGLKILRSPFLYIASQETLSAALDEVSESWADGAKGILAADPSARKEAFLKLPFIDISSTVFQQSRGMHALEIQYEFIDVGRFEEIYELNTKDDKGNVVIGKVVLGPDCRNNLIIYETDVPLVIIDKEHTVVVQTAAGSLVSSFTQAAKVGEIYKSQIHGR